MALTGTLAIQELKQSGITPTYAAGSTDGHYFKNDGHVVLHVKNTGSQITLTFPTPASAGNGLAVADPTGIVPATTGDMFFGPFNPDQFNDSQGRALVNLSGQTGVTIAAIRRP